MDFKARPTTYRGIQMRSRLEAYYAGILDALELTWSYEPRAFAGTRGQYLPDFLVQDGPIELYVEVKPTIEQAMAILPRMEVILESRPQAWLDVWVRDAGDFTRSPFQGGLWRWEPLGEH